MAHLRGAARVVKVVPPLGVGFLVSCLDGGESGICPAASFLQRWGEVEEGQWWGWGWEVWSITSSSADLKPILFSVHYCLAFKILVLLVIPGLPYPYFIFTFLASLN